jgi:hypothetical protein
MAWRMDTKGACEGVKGDRAGEWFKMRGEESMGRIPKLEFKVLDMRPDRFALSPQLVVRVQVAETSGVRIHSMLLRCQIRMDPASRGYSQEETLALKDLFGPGEQWSHSVHPFMWTQVATVAGGFEGRCLLEIPVACTYDMEIASSKYLHALREGEIPLLFLFSGTVFSREVSPNPGDGSPSTVGHEVFPVSWSSEARYRLPVAVWDEVMDLYFPGKGWICVSKAVLDEVARFKTENAFATFEEAIEALLSVARDGIRSFGDEQEKSGV